MQERRQIKVARLLGKSVLEVVELGEDSYCEFYWQLPNILPKACKRNHYGEDVEMYFDFHRALDQVEDIIREVSQESFALVPDSDSTTWLERAQKTVNGKEGDSSVIGSSVSSEVRQWGSSCSCWNSFDVQSVCLTCVIFFCPWSFSETRNRRSSKRYVGLVRKVKDFFSEEEC